MSESGSACRSQVARSEQWFGIIGSGLHGVSVPRSLSISVDSRPTELWGKGVLRNPPNQPPNLVRLVRWVRYDWPLSLILLDRLLGLPDPVDSVVGSLVDRIVGLRLSVVRSESSRLYHPRPTSGPHWSSRAFGVKEVGVCGACLPRFCQRYRRLGVACGELGFEFRCPDGC
ncbi:hypothetical protein U1Q18_017578 [Sarracenia purpurea var. burkii]